MSSEKTAASAAEIRHCPAFAGLTDDELREMAGALERVRARADEDLIREGESRAEKQGLFVLLEGQARVLKKGRELAVVPAPSVFGEVEYLTRIAPTATVKPVGPASIYWLGRAKLDEMLRAGNLAAYKLLANLGRVLAQRLRATDEKIVELVAADKRQEFSQFRAKILSEWSF